MEADDLLQQIGRHARNEAAPPVDDPVWEKLARGELSPSEDAELRERAAADPEVATLYEAFRPLDEAARARIADRVDTALHGARVVSWRRAALIAGVVAPLAAAALLVLYLRASPAPEPLALIPEYSLALAGGDRATRSGTPTESVPVELHRGSRVEIILRPAMAAKRPVVVRAFLLQGTLARAWEVPMDRSADGAVRIEGEAGTLLGVPPGSWDLAFTVGLEGSAAPDPDEVGRAARGDGGDRPWRLVETRIRLLDGT